MGDPHGSGAFMSEDSDGDFDPNNPSQSTPGEDAARMGLLNVMDMGRRNASSPASSAGGSGALERIVSQDFPHSEYYMVADGLNRNPNWTVYPAQVVRIEVPVAVLAHEGPAAVRVAHARAHC